jgi:hypothetical protein
VVLRIADSWKAPTTAQLAACKANGVQGFAGYFSTGSDGIYGGGWSDAAFQAVQAAGLKTLAFCSTRADPVAWKARAARLGIVIVADVERSVQGGDGPSVDPWLAASGARLYGGGPRGDGTITRHLHHGHSGYVLADYENGLGGWGSTSWPTGDPRPNAPTGWQYSGGATHPWGNTDLGIYDDALVSPGVAPSEEDVPWLLYKVTGGDTTEWVFTGTNTWGMTPAGVAALVANGNLKTNVPQMVDEGQHKTWAAAPAPVVVTGGGTTPPASGVLSGTITISPK